MFFAEFPQILLRRWYLVVAGVVAAVVTAGFTFATVSPGYDSRAELLLLPPKTSVPPGGNPYLALGGLEATSGVLSAALMSQTSEAELKRAGASGEYTVGLDQTSPAPLLLVEVTSDSSAKSMEMMRLILRRIPPTLVQIQRSAEVPSTAYITSTPVSVSEKPTVKRKGQLRIVMMASVAILALVLLLTAAIDALLIRRRFKRSEAALPVQSEHALTPEVRQDPEPEVVADAGVAAPVRRALMPEEPRLHTEPGLHPQPDLSPNPDDFATPRAAPPTAEPEVVARVADHHGDVPKTQPRGRASRQAREPSRRPRTQTRNGALSGASTPPRDVTTTEAEDASVESAGAPTTR